MPRANRYYVPGHAWHITHRCHNRDFLLKYGKDRLNWLRWLFEARKRYGLVILNYMVTSNHIHLLVHDKEGGDAIPRSLQLAAGRTAQAFNQRKDRKGAFWEDRYHATAVQTDQHLAQCIVYMDLNMVRAGAVTHPSLWPHSGYREIQTPPKRYALIDRIALMLLFGMSDSEQLSRSHRRWVEEAIEARRTLRESLWSESVAVGSRAFVGRVKVELGGRGLGRKIVPGAHGHELREDHHAYGNHFDPRNEALSATNLLPWRFFDEESIT